MAGALSDTKYPSIQFLMIFSALVDAILEGHGADSARIVQLLLDAGADVNLQGGHYGCPLAVSSIFCPKLRNHFVFWSTARG